MPQAVGKLIVIGKTDEQIYVFDLNRDGNTEAFIRLRAPLKLSSGASLPDGFIELLALYDRSTNDWTPVLSSVYSGGSWTLSEALARTIASRGEPSRRVGS